MSGAQKPVSFDRLLGELRHLMDTLAQQYPYWEVRIIGSNGKARVEVIYQVDTYPYQENGELIKRVK